MSKWTDLEEVLIEGYASPEYAQWYEESTGKTLPSNFDPVARGKSAAYDLRKTFESGSKSDWMKNNQFSGWVVRAAFGFRTTKEWREAWVGAPIGPSKAQVKRDERALIKQEAEREAEKDFKRRRWLQSGKNDAFSKAYTRRMRELHGMSPDY